MLEFIHSGLVIAALHTGTQLPILVLFMLILPLPEYENFFTSPHAGLSLLGMWRLVTALFTIYVAFEALLRYGYHPRGDRRGKLLSAIGVVALLAQQGMYSAVGEASYRWSATYRIPLSIRNLESADANLRYQAASDLGWYGSRSRAAVPCLIKALDDESWVTRCAAASSLGAIGADAGTAVPALLRVSSEDPDRSVRTSAMNSIKRILALAR